ncbi:MAG: molybdopterin-dependent oxidoreductase [Acidobacteriota bacterium]|nr:molybdopterin-dependent oxidoreductase [Acidobacteriota bacterium]
MPVGRGPHPRRRRETLTLDRRGFLGVFGAGILGTTLYGCAGRQRLLEVADPASESVSPAAVRQVASICGNCVNKCGFIARVEGERVVKLEPNPHFPKSRNMLCAKGNAGVKVVHDPDRLKHPLIRTGPRGSGQWRKAGWDEALDFTARRMMEIKEKYGPHGMLFSSTEGFQERFFRTFGAAWGSPNVVRHPSLCLASGNVAFFATFGTVPEYDLEHCEYVIVSGANRAEAFITPDTIDMMTRARRGQMRLVYLDPRFSVTAARAGTWLPIRPGTDMAFYLAMLHVLIDEKLYDAAFVAAYTHGFDELVEHVKPFTPAWAERETEIPAGEIRRITREFAAAAPRAVVYRGRRSSWYGNDTHMRQAMALVNALVGNWDREGGVVPKESIALGKPEIPELPWPDEERVDGIEERHPLARIEDGVYVDLREQVLAGQPYPVKGWMIYKQNPLHALPDRARTRKMLEQMEFVAVIDIVPSDTAWMADVILPESTYLERTDPVEGFHQPYAFLAWRRQVVRPRFATRSCLEIMQGLAGRLGIEKYFDYDIDEYVSIQLAKPGLSREVFDETGVWSDRSARSYGKTLSPDYRFRTPSGKIELANERFRRRGYAPLPVYVPPAQPPEGHFRLLPAKQSYFTHAANQNNLWLHELCPENALWINAKVAGRRGIAEGDEVLVKSSVGQVRVKAHVTEGIREDCVHLPHGFGQRSAGLHQAVGKGASDQDLIASATDAITGNAALHETFVTVEKA